MAGEIEDLENTLGYDPLPARPGRPNKRGRRKKLVCKQGHPFVEGNISYRANGTRFCTTCQKASRRAWLLKNPDYSAKHYAAKNGRVISDEIKLRFRWDGQDGRVVGMDVLKLKETDWVIAADFLKDVIHLAQNCYDDVLKAKHVDKGADHGG